METTIPTEILPWLANARAVSALVATAAVLVGGIVGLRRYRHGLRIKAGELLLEMEGEFRRILPTFLELELLPSYRRRFAPVLALSLRRADLSDAQIETLQRVDRCLRFFFLCTVLHNDLRIEQAALARSYYWYARLLIAAEERPELAEYVERHYQRLAQWVHQHLPCFAEYQHSGQWIPALRDRQWQPPPGEPARCWRATGVSLVPLVRDPAHDATVDGLEEALGVHFREAMDDWRSHRQRPYPLEHWHVYVATDARDGDAVGVCGYYRHPDDEPGRYWLGWLGVAEECRRRGYGSAMVSAVAAELSDRGAEELWVYADGSDAGARAFYLANGFSARGRFSELGLEQAAAGPESVVFARSLAAAS